MNSKPSLTLTYIAAISFGVLAAENGLCETSVTLPVSDPMNAVWDLSVFDDAQKTDIEISDGSGAVWLEYDSPFVQNGGGKFIGSGATTVHLEYDGDTGQVTVDPFTATYSSKGSISSSKGMARITFTSSVRGTAFMEGRLRTASASFTATAVIDSAHKTWSGRTSAKAGAAGLGSVKDADTFAESIPPALGDGTWTLVLDFDPMVNNRVTGTGRVTLASGKVMTFDAKGVYTPKRSETRVTLRGSNEGLGASLQVRLVNGEVKAVTGRISGQTINIIK